MALNGSVPFSNGGGERFECAPNMYFVRLVDIEEAPANANRNPEWGPSWKWRFVVADQNGKIISSSRTTAGGAPTPLEFWQFTSDKLGTAPSGIKAKARQYFESLLRKELTGGENAESLRAEAIGCVAQAYITKNPKGTAMQIGNMTPLDDDTFAKIAQRQKELMGATVGAPEADPNDPPF